MSLIRIGERIHVPTSDDEPGAMRYHVSRGESLSGIARRIYGDSKLWLQIHEANRCDTRPRLDPPGSGPDPLSAQPPLTRRPGGTIQDRRCRNAIGPG